MDPEWDQPASTLEFEDSMVRIHESLEMEIPEWLQH